MKKALPRLILPVVAFCYAFGNGAPLVAEQVPELTSSEKPGLEKLGAKINLPQGWTIREGSTSLSLIAEEPEVENQVPGVTYYRRNITVAGIFSSSPIDQTRIGTFTEELQSQFSKTTPSFRIIESKLIDYRPGQKAILVFSELKLGEDELMQMHLLVSGAKNQGIVTYTDLKPRFANEENYQAAWNSLISFELEGLAPVRYADLMIYGGSAFGFLIFMFGLMTLRTRRSSKAYSRDSDVIYSDDAEIDLGFNTSVTQPLEWRINSQNPKSQVSSIHSQAAWFA